MGSTFMVTRGTNTYCGIVEISFLMHHQIPYNLAKNEYPQDSDVAMVEYTKQPTMGGEHRGNNENNMPLSPLQDIAIVKNIQQPTMGGEQGVNNENNMPQAPLQDVAAVENIEQPTISGEQGGNNENKSPVQQTLDEGASSRKSVPRPPSLPPSPPTKTPTIHQMINSYEPKTKSSDVELF
jgi:hypothetical protein